MLTSLALLLAAATAFSPGASPRGHHAVRSSRTLRVHACEDAQRRMYFVMGGPGSGKGTQCERLVEKFHLTHLSAGELLRKEAKADTPLGLEIAEIMKEGKIVPSEVTVRLLTDAMSGSGPFLIDGFPRSLSNLEAFEACGQEPAFMLFLEVSEDEMLQRLAHRGLSSGRSDDNEETIRKRFRTYLRDSMPVVEALQERGAVRSVDAQGSPDDVFARVCAAFADQELASREAHREMVAGAA